MYLKTYIVGILLQFKVYALIKEFWKVWEVLGAYQCTSSARFAGDSTAQGTSSRKGNVRGQYGSFRKLGVPLKGSFEGSLKGSIRVLQRVQGLEFPKIRGTYLGL